MRFLNKKTGEIGEAYKIEKKVHIQFTESGKEYLYDEKNIEVLEDEVVESKVQENDKKNQMLVYSFKRKCYSAKCGKITEILTYIKFDDGTNEDLTFPWDKKRLNENKSSEDEMYHMMNPSIEYYPINVIGSDKELDKIMLKVFPERIHMEYSSTQKRKYPMNVCQHCGAKQGEYFIYEWINKVIQKMEDLPVFQVVDAGKYESI